jgi:hypothetical protein
MGVQVWMLGQSRAIPRNYNHVVINDSKLDWLGQVKNYNDVVIAAVSETPEKHAFVTEYAGPSAVMVDVLDAPARFGSSATLAAFTEAPDFVEYLFDHGFAIAQPSTPFGGPVPALLPPLTKSLVLAAIPMPVALKAKAITEDDWLRDLRYFLGGYRASNPQDFEGWSLSFDAPALAAALEQKVVTPAREAGQLFRAFPKLTRLYTTLSPEDMTRDPVFSFNPSLPDVSRDHTAVLTIDCSPLVDFSSAPRTLKTEQGWILSGGRASAAVSAGPSALRIETILEEGAPQVLTDNSGLIGKTLGCGGCTAVDPVTMSLAALALLLRRRRAR